MMVLQHSWTQQTHGDKTTPRPKLRMGPHLVLNNRMIMSQKVCRRPYTLPASNEFLRSTSRRSAMRCRCGLQHAARSGLYPQGSPKQGPALFGTQRTPHAELLFGVRKLRHVFPVEALHDCSRGPLRLLQLPDSLPLLPVEPPEPALRQSFAI